MQTVPIFVVSLPREAERRASVGAMLDRLGLAYEFVDGVDGRAMPEEERRALFAPGAADVFHNPGIVGCYLAHLKVYRLMVERRVPVALVIEDDAALRPAIVPLLRQGLSWSGFDYCILSHVGDNEEGPTFYDPDTRREIFPGVATCETHGAPAGTAAYLITLPAAEKRLEHAFPIHKPIDIYTALPYRPHFRIPVGAFLAGLAETAMRSGTSPRDDLGRLSFRRLRRLPGYYEVRDALNRDRLLLRLGVHALVRKGVLPKGRRWRPIPGGWRFIV